jgi:hypothetical protein
MRFFASSAPARTREKLPISLTSRNGNNRRLVRRGIGKNFFIVKPRYAVLAPLVAAMKLSVAAEWASLREAIPTTNGAGAGASGRIFNRGPDRQSKPCWTRATPRPASTEAMRLVALSCSSAMCGERLRGAKRPASQAWYSG